MKRAFTLIEALVTIFIIALLASILFPVLISSKQAAVKTDDIAKLRQLGQAAAMYEDRFGEFPLTTEQVVGAGLVPTELCASSRDTSVNGIANDLARYNQRRFSGVVRPQEVNYKNTFVGPGEFGMGSPMVRDYVLSGPGAGWLIDATESEKGLFPTPTQWKGKYRRLCMDGSVVIRQHKDFECYNHGQVQPCRMPVLLFVDPSPYFAELQKSNDQQFSASVR